MRVKSCSKCYQKLLRHSTVILEIITVTFTGIRNTKLKRSKNVRRMEAVVILLKRYHIQKLKEGHKHTELHSEVHLCDTKIWQHQSWCFASVVAHFQHYENTRRGRNVARFRTLPKSL